ncbi:hypothetical protein M3181_19170 [Mesobacillus maritimus]|uniref:hypothetical protein n=1 Tax=Mesobacillus maritimus TaxID=1643336 RepID=UPI00203EA1C0|nr:hypothetical protein [Mesobacillus maritimus]MCM3671085.1 hypothetical protein [Mesobacillus maritimus]
MLNHFFIIEGDKETGNYVVMELNNGSSKKIFENRAKYYGGLKEARQAIGSYLINCGYSCNQVFLHQCIKPNRKFNPTHEWTVEQYLFGVPQEK